jgi:putative tricarboxylic transport membrane protein
MTGYRRTELALSFFLVALGVATVLGAWYTIPELSVLRDLIGARGFAYVVGALVALGGVVLVAMQVKALRPAVAGPSGDELGGDEPAHPASALRAFSVIGALILYAVLLRPAGYIPATVLFVGAGTFLMGGRGLTRLLVFPLLYAIGTYLLFDTLLGVRIPDGVLRPLIVAIGFD